VKLRIVIDNEDSSDSEDAPLTLNVYRDDDDESKSFDDGGNCLLGSSLPGMLRALAEEIENGTVGEPEEFDLCSRCREWNDDGEGYDGLCGNCADVATCGECGEVKKPEVSLCHDCTHVGAEVGIKTV
jgi:hypothetical protein